MIASPRLPACLGQLRRHLFPHRSLPRTSAPAHGSAVLMQPTSNLQYCQPVWERCPITRTTAISSPPPSSSAESRREHARHTASAKPPQGTETSVSPWLRRPRAQGYTPSHVLEPLAPLDVECVCTSRYIQRAQEGVTWQTRRTRHMAPAGRGCCGNPSRSPGSRRAPPPSPGPDRHSGDNASPGRAHTGRVVCPSRDILGKIDGPETTGPRRRHRASGLDLLSSQIGSPPGRRRGQRCHGSSLRRQDTEPQLCPPFVPPAPPDQPPLGFPSVPSHIPLTPPPLERRQGVSPGSRVHKHLTSQHLSRPGIGHDSTTVGAAAFHLPTFLSYLALAANKHHRRCSSSRGRTSSWPPKPSM